MLHKCFKIILKCAALPHDRKEKGEGKEKVFLLLMNQQTKHTHQQTHTCSVSVHIEQQTDVRTRKKCPGLTGWLHYTLMTFDLLTAADCVQHKYMHIININLNVWVICCKYIFFYFHKTFCKYIGNAFLLHLILFCELFNIWISPWIRFKSLFYLILSYLILLCVLFRQQQWSQTPHSRSTLTLTVAATSLALVTTFWRLWFFPSSTPFSSWWGCHSTPWQCGCFSASPHVLTSSSIWRILWSPMWSWHSFSLLRFGQTGTSCFYRALKQSNYLICVSKPLVIC